MDVDKYDPKSVTETIARVRAASLPLIPAWSKSAGLHLWAFYRDRVQVVVSAGLMDDARKLIGLPEGVEIFPKQSRIDAARGDVGNWIIMPYFGSTFDGKLREQVGIDEEGRDLPIGRFLDMAEAARLGPDQLVTFGTKRRKRAAATTADGPADFSDGPPCLEALARDGVEERRNDALHMMGRYFKRKRPDGWEPLVEEANRRHMRPPLPSEEVVAVLRSLRKKDYPIKCMDERLCGAECRSRPFGKGGGGETEYPTILRIRKRKSDPVLWTVETQHGVLEHLTTSQFTKYSRFNDICYERLNHRFPTMGQAKWDAAIGGAPPIEEYESEDDTDDVAAFDEILTSFLTDHRRGKRMEDLAGGAPWEDEEGEMGRGSVYWFRMSSLEHFMKNNRRLAAERNNVWIGEQIRRLGGGRDNRYISGRKTRVWFVPSSAVERWAPEVTPPVPGTAL